MQNQRQQRHSKQKHMYYWQKYLHAQHNVTVVVYVIVDSPVLDSPISSRSLLWPWQETPLL